MEDNEVESALTYVFRRNTPPKRQRVAENYESAAIIPSPSAETSMESGILAPGWYRKDPAKHDSGL